VSGCDTALSVVTGNNIGDVGAQALANALQSNRRLTTLDLGSACFTAAIVAVDVVMCWICARGV
jgi:hypothetical protein